MARILIVEDRESMREALKTLFNLRSEWTVCGEAEDANEAIAKAIKLNPDLIIMDYKMHHCDGLVAADGIFRVLPNVPIVMFTLYKTDELEHAANLMGIRCVVGKEEGVQTLLSAVDNELSRSDPMHFANKKARTTSSRLRSIPKESIFPRSFAGFDSEI